MTAGIIDVREAGAAGDGRTDDGPALAAAFAAAGPAGVRVPPGRYRVACDLACHHPVRFEGQLAQAEGRLLILGQRLSLGDYAAAFGSGHLALAKALAALFAVEGDADLDLGGREIHLPAPIRIDAAGARGTKTVRGGRISLAADGDWPAARPDGAAGSGDIGRMAGAPVALGILGLAAGAVLDVQGVDLRLGGRGGGLCVQSTGGSVAMTDCDIAGARSAAVRVLGRGTGGLALDRCRIRDGAGVEAAGMGAVVTACRFDRAAPALTLAGRGNRVSGCRIAPGGAGLRPGLVLRRRDAACQVADCDFDGASILWGETAAAAVAGGEFAGLSVTGCRFTGRDLPRHARWIEIAPGGPGRSLRDVSVTGSLFAVEGGRVDRAESARRSLDPGRMRRITFAGNVYRGVARPAENPATIRVRLPRPERNWSIDLDGALPFDAPPGQVVAVLPEGALRDGAGEPVRENPSVELSPEGLIRLRFAAPSTGALALTLRADRPG